MRQEPVPAVVADLMPPLPRRKSTLFWSRALLAAAVIIAANGIFGERGLMDTMRARRAYAEATADLARLRQQNAALRAEMHALTSDPTTIESVARQDLGLARPDEIVVRIHTLTR
jgi:cell division protein FtsB